MNDIEKRYSLNALAKTTGYNYRTLRKWIDKSWLLPSGTTGRFFKYTMMDLRRAEAHSLMALKQDKNKFKPRMTAEHFLLTLT